MANFINQIPNNITEYPNSFKRQGSFPLEAYSVFTSYEEASNYAKNNLISYIGQPLAVAFKKEEKTTVDYYIIGDEEGTLIHIGNSDHNLDELNQRIEEIEKFFQLEEGESLKETLDQLIELQKWIEEHLEDVATINVAIQELQQAVVKLREDLDNEIMNRAVADAELKSYIEDLLFNTELIIDANLLNE